MIVKNKDAILRMITRLDTILEVDDTVSNMDRRWIHTAILALQKVNGLKKVSLEENMKALGYDNPNS